jgi:hypothetical protein
MNTKDKLRVGIFEEQNYQSIYFMKNVRPKKVTRNCLRCERKFKSLGSHNRVCRDCQISPVYCGASQVLDFCP